MSNLRAICRPQAVFSSMACCYRSMVTVSSLIESSSSNIRISRSKSCSSIFAVWFEIDRKKKIDGDRLRRNQQRRMVATKASNWTESKSPYETLELERDADEEQIKIDPEEERKILVKEKKASIENFNSTLKRHTLVLRKRDLMRKKAEDDKKKIIAQLLAIEGLELDKDEDE